VLTLAVYGDAPYGTSNSDTAEFDAIPAFIDPINSGWGVLGLLASAICWLECRGWC
jgi:hypothetical protein